VRTVRDRGPSGFGPDRPGPDRVQYSNENWMHDILRSKSMIGMCHSSSVQSSPNSSSNKIFCVAFNTHCIIASTSHVSTSLAPTLLYLYGLASKAKPSSQSWNPSRIYLNSRRSFLLIKGEVSFFKTVIPFS
jgi:hypothetical protein